MDSVLKELEQRLQSKIVIEYQENNGWWLNINGEYQGLQTWGGNVDNVTQELVAMLDGMDMLKEAEQKR